MAGAKMYLLLIALSVVVIVKSATEDVSSDMEEYDFQTKRVLAGNKSQQQQPTGENVIEKFVGTLMSSEKHLRMIGSLQQKINHLDTVFHHDSNRVFEYLSELLRTSKSNQAVLLDMQGLKSDIHQVKTVLQEHCDRPGVRKGADFHPDSNMDSRLTFLENHSKSIQAGVDSIMATISEVKNRQFSRPFSSVTSGRSDTIPSLDAMALIAEFRKTLRDQKSNKKCDCKNGRVDRSERYPTDCHEIQAQGFNVSGIYKIRPDDMDPFYVLCDLTTAGGGWTVFQNRFDGSQDFLKGWKDYEYGFGNLAGEFWLGLDKLNYVTNQKLYELRIEMETQRGQEAYAGYSVFTVGPEHEGYRISTLGSFYGTAGDSLSYHAGQKFSTHDVDNDEWKDGSCSVEHGGAWWYKECDKSNLNGKYTQPGDENRGQSMYWISFKGPNSPLSKTKMMIRPLPASKPIDYSETNRNLVGSPKHSVTRDKTGSPLELRGKSMNKGHHNKYKKGVNTFDVYSEYEHDNIPEDRNVF